MMPIILFHSAGPAVQMHDFKIF